MPRPKVPTPLQKVPAQWPRKLPCKIAFVGEAPGEVERLRGAPFQGPAGHMFDQLMQTAGLDRAEYLVTNVFDEQLPRNQIANWCVDSAQVKELGESYNLPKIGTIGYLDQGHVSHLRRLGQEILSAKPNLIVPLGGTALWAFTGDAGISAARGSTILASMVAPGIKLLPTLHPAHVLHDFKQFHVVVIDLIKAAHEAEFKEIRHSKRTIWVEPTLADLCYFKKNYLDKSSLISVDIETKAGLIDCIGFSADSQYAIVVPFFDPRKASRSYWVTPEAELQAWLWVQSVCSSPIPKLGQNGGCYDLFWLLDQAKIAVTNYREDTRLLHHALYPELPKSLGFMGATYGSEGPWKGMRNHKADKRDE